MKEDEYVISLNWEGALCERTPERLPRSTTGVGSGEVRTRAGDSTAAGGRRSQEDTDSRGWKE